jgi:hypothetical protein
LNHFRFKKVTKEKAKNPLEWWRVHEVEFSYVGSHIEVERVFIVAGICTNLQHSRLGINNIEMLINIYKNWSNDVRVEGLASMKQFMDMEEAFMEENESLIDQLGLLNIEENGNRL